MKIKQLMKQLWSEKRSVAFLFFELLFVFVVLWYIINWSYQRITAYMEPLGFDITNTYLVNLQEKESKFVEYTDREERETTLGEDMLKIVRRLRLLPDVEYVSVSNSSRPYTGSNSGTGFAVDSMYIGTLRRWVTPDFFQVFRYRNIDESSPYTLTELLKENKVIVSENLFPDKEMHSNLKGKSLYFSGDSTKRYEIAAFTQKVRYNDFSPNYNDEYIALELTEKDLAEINSEIFWYEVCLRVKPGTREDFPEYIMNMSDRNLDSGRLFILNVESFEKIRENILQEDINAMKLRMWMLGFLLVNIFLGIIGTFWFRTQHRKAEMGLRIAMGSTRRGLWSYLNKEGLLLLTMASIPGAIICYGVERTGLATEEWNTLGFVVCIIITYLLMLIMILSGISYPAYQAMKTEPTDALKEE